LGFAQKYLPLFRPALATLGLLKAANNISRLPLPPAISAFFFDTAKENPPKRKRLSCVFFCHRQKKSAERKRGKNLKII